MMSSTHVVFARQIHDHIKLRYGVSLKKSSLIYGCIKPDASTIFAKYPHYIDKSLLMVSARINMLRDIAFNRDNLETRAFARELGVCLHYLADYFCRVHNDINGIKHNEGVIHISYERKLNKKLNIEDLEAIREAVLLKLDDDIKFINKFSVYDFIVLKHRKYMKEAGKLFLYNNISRRYEIDLRFAMECMIVVASYILS